MSASIVQGRGVKIWAYNTDGYYDFFCGQSCQINFQTEQIPATNTGSAGFRAFENGLSSWDVDFNGVTMVKDTSDAKWSVFDLVKESVRKNGLDLMMVFSNINGSTNTFLGHANISSISNGGVVGQIAKYTIKFQGSGGFTLSDSIPQTKANDVQSYLYTATGGETSIQYNDLINRFILMVFRGGPLQQITNGTPNGQQYRWSASDQGLGQIVLDPNSALASNEKVLILYR